MRVAKAVMLTEEQRTQLQRWARGRSTPARLVLRAKIVLLAAEGRRNDEIAAVLRCPRATVGIWRQGFVYEGVADIEKDAPRPGRDSVVRKKVGAKILRKTTQEK